MLNSEAAVQAIAEAYRAAALAQADMRRTAEALESLREVMAGESRPFPVWDDSDDHIDEAHGQNYQKILLDLRQWFIEHVVGLEVSQINAAYSTDPENGWQTFLGAYAEALSFWRVPLCLQLLDQEFPVPPQYQGDFDQLRQGTNYILKALWPQARALFLYLTRQDFLPPPERARFHKYLGEIELYHLFRLPEAKSEFDLALGLAPEDPEVLMGQGEYWLYQKDLAKARDFFQRAILASPKSAMVYCYMGDTFQSEGNEELAEKWYREAISRRPGDTSGHLRLIKLLGWAKNPQIGQENLIELVNRIQTIDATEYYDACLEAGFSWQQRKENALAHEWFHKSLESDPSRIQAYTSEGYLLLEEHKIEEARQCFAKAIEIASDSLDGYWGMARLSEQQSDWAAAEHWYRESLLRRPEWPGQSRAFIASMTWKQGRGQEAEAMMLEALSMEPESQTILGMAERLANDTSREAQDLPGAVRIFGEIRRILGDAYAAPYWNNLGELYFAIPDYPKAAQAYRQALEADRGPQFYYINLARALLKIPDYEGGRKLWDDAPEQVKQNQDFRREMSFLRNGEANDLFARGDYRGAVPLYEEAITFAPQDSVLYSNLALALEDDKSPDGSMERLGRAITTLHQAIDLDPKGPASASYAQRLKRLEALQRLATSFGKKALQRLPQVSPVSLEIAANLIPLVEGTSSGHLSPPVMQLLTQMRAEILSGYGLSVPGVWVRGNETDLPEGLYIIFLNEIPRARGTISLSRRFCPFPPERLETLEVHAEKGQNPETGEAASWVDEKDWDKVLAAGYDLWDVLEYPVRHLKERIVHNLTEFCGNQEVYNLIDRHASGQLKILAEMPGALPILTRVLRALLAEQVPISPLVEICRKFCELQNAGVQPLNLVEELRLLPEIRPKLPGNQPDTRLWMIGEDLAGLLNEAMYHCDPVPVLALEPRACQEVLDMLRAHIGTSREALVIQNGALRPFLRRLVELEWPDLPVLAQHELLPEFSSQVVGEIHLKE